MTPVQYIALALQKMDIQQGLQLRNLFWLEAQTTRRGPELESG